MLVFPLEICRSIELQLGLELASVETSVVNCSRIYHRSLMYDPFYLKPCAPSTSLANDALDVVARQKSDVADIYNPYAHFSLEVAQEINSLEVITEIDPLEIAEIFGEVGGAWGEQNRL